MADIRASLHAAVTEGEPPLGFTAPGVIAAAHRARRRKRAGYAAVTAAAAVAAVTVLTLPGGGASGGGMTAARSGPLSLTALTRIAADHAKTPVNVKGTAVSLTGKEVEGVTAAQVVALAEKTAQVRLTSAQASILAPAGELDLAAAVAVSGHPYLNIQVIPAHNLITAKPTCAELSDAGTGDGYYGPCSIKRLADGSLLIARSGMTKSGGLTMAQASVIRPDGSGVFAEDDNQAQSAEQGKAGVAVSGQPPIDSAVLARLVQAIAARG